MNEKKGYVTLDNEGKCEGRKTHKELDPNLVLLVKKLRKRNWKTKKQKSYRLISQTIADQGYLNENGKPYNPKSIRDMVLQ